MWFRLMPMHNPLKGFSPTSGLLVAGFMVVASLMAGCGPHDVGGTVSVAAKSPTAGGAQGWNVVLLSVDTVRADRLNSYGYSERSTSPKIDQLLASGVRVARAVAPRALTWPSLASVLTGQYPSSHGLVGNGYKFADGQRTLAHSFAGEGYATSAFLSNMCEANHQGWDHFACSDGDDSLAIAEAVDWWSELAPEEPRFMWVHLFATHSPYRNGRGHVDRLDPDYDGPLEMRSAVINRLVSEEGALSARDRAHLDAMYDAAMMGTDLLVSELLKGLEPGGQLDRTLIIFLSDHGEELYDHNQYAFHACSMYETVLHVPLAFIAPGVLPTGTVSTAAAELLDVAPTIAELVGVEPPPDIEGVSLVPYLSREGHGNRRKAAFSEYDPNAKIHTVFLDNWKLIRNPTGKIINCRRSGRPFAIAPIELYQVTADPLEQSNLSAGQPDRVAYLSSLIEARFADAPAAEVQEIEPELRQKLEGLGYLTR